MPFIWGAGGERISLWQRETIGEEIPPSPSQPLNLVIRELRLIQCNHRQLAPRMLYKVPLDGNTSDWAVCE